MSEAQGPATAEVNSLPMDTQATDATSDHAIVGSASPSDNASSLRAKALLSLKSKRRKPATDHHDLASPSQRPIPTGLVLNYGEEESLPSTTAPPSAIEKTATFPTTKTMALETEDNREEGEISDTENTLPAAPKAKAFVKKSKGSSTDKKSSSNASPTSTNPPAPVKPLFTPEQQMEGTPATPVAGPSTSIAPFLPAQPQTAPYTLDADHVRPGLASL